MITSKPKFTLADGQALIDEFKQSALKPKEFCAQKNISYHILQYWRTKCGEHKPNAIINSPNLLPVKILKHNLSLPSIKILVSTKLQIEVPGDMDVLRLKNIIQACMACG